MSKTLQALLSENVIRLRKEQGLSQRDLTKKLRESGITWSQASLAAVETRKREVSAGELLLLQYALGGLPELLWCDGDVEVEVAVLTPAELRSLALGRPGERPSQITIRPDLAERWKITDTDRRSGVALGYRLDRVVPATEVAKEAQVLFGRSLEEERSARVGVGPGNQRIRRGHTTRALLNELEVHMKKKSRRRTRRS